MKPKLEHEIPKKKLKAVKELEDLIKDKKTILISSIKSIPASQFQEISKSLRDKAIIKVPKKSIIFRAIDSSQEEVKQLKEQIKENVAVLFSDLESFDLAAELVKSKTPAKARAGQEAPSDVEIPEGPTDLIPGPAISELGALGIPIQIQEGKISIKSPTVIVKQGERISENAASIMSKLGIKPFTIGFEPLAAFDTKENKLYLDIKIDREGTLEQLKEAFSKSLGFSVEIGYISDDTIKFLISKASSHEKALEKFEGEVKEESKEESVEKPEAEEKVEEKVEEVKEEPKAEETSKEEVKPEETQEEKPDENQTQENKSSVSTQSDEREENR